MRLPLLSLVIAMATALPAFGTELPGGTADGDTLRAAESPYLLTGDLLVQDMYVEPGVTVEAGGDYEILIRGLLLAVGTETDSIRFTAADTVAGWHGLFFEQSFPQTEIAFCRIERSLNSGIRIDNSAPVIRNCLITGNTAQVGAGVRVSGPLAVTLTQCVIEGNEYEGGGPRGGGIYTTADLTLDRCQILDNRIEDYRGCFGQGNATTFGGGIYSEGSLTLQNVMVEGNVALSRGGAENSRGGGIYSAGTLTARNSWIIQNESPAGGCNTGGGARGYGGGMYLGGDSSTLVNCIVAEGDTRTSGGGIYVAGGVAATIENCTIVFCEDTGGLTAGAGSNVQLKDCIVYFNIPSQLSGPVVATFSDVEGGWEGEGNISQHPLIILDPEEPAELGIRPGSPCIDAGDPLEVYNDLCFPPSYGTSRNDMGAHGGPGACDWLPETTPISPPSGGPVEVVPANVRLLQNQPNPATTSTVIPFGLENEARVTFEIYDLQGRRILSEYLGYLSIGVHDVRWDGRDDRGVRVSSGQYYYSVLVDGARHVRKLVLVE